MRGYVYIMESPTLTLAHAAPPDSFALKIGYTTINPRIRRLELCIDQYGGVDDWRLINSWYTLDPERAEARIHKRLKKRNHWLSPYQHGSMRDRYGNASIELFTLGFSEATKVIRRGTNPLTLKKLLIALTVLVIGVGIAAKLLGWLN